MTLSSDMECKQGKRCNHCYVHVEFLPWEACQNDVRKFFNEFEIISGGILIHGHSAFVAFKDQDTAEEAVRRSDAMFHGRPVYLSIVDKESIRDISLRNARRSLKFESTVSKDDGSMLSFVVSQKKKIRPTAVKQERLAISCTSFSPEEMESPTVQYKTTKRSFSSVAKQLKRSRSVIRKIHPTRMDNDNEWVKFPVFHPEKCYEVKKIRLENAQSCC